MSGFGYSQYTIDRMDAVWKNLASYCEEHNDGLLTAESARGFVWDLYGAVLGEKDASQNVNRAVHILLDFQQFGMIFKQSHMTLKSFSDASLHFLRGKHCRQPVAVCAAHIRQGAGKAPAVPAVCEGII